MPRQTVGGVALALFTVTLGVYLSVKLANQDVLRLFYALALVALAKGIFAWGTVRGFAVRNDDGTLHTAHLVRNVAMTLLAVPIVLLLASPFTLLAFQFAR